MDKILFHETQRFRQWWIWALLSVPFASLLIGYLAEDEIQIPPLFIVAVIPVVIVLFLFILKLETKITSDGIHFRFFPFHLNFKYYAWEKISEKKVRSYKPIAEYGGWGIRGFHRNRAFNVSGNQGLQLVFVDGRRLLIGTQKPDEITAILTQL